MSRAAVVKADWIMSFGFPQWLTVIGQPACWTHCWFCWPEMPEMAVLWQLGAPTLLLLPKEQAHFKIFVHKRTDFSPDIPAINEILYSFKNLVWENVENPYKVPIQGGISEYKIPNPWSRVQVINTLRGPTYTWPKDRTTENQIMNYYYY